jgi:hypothetical protein
VLGAKSKEERKIFKTPLAGSSPHYNKKPILYYFGRNRE